MLGHAASLRRFALSLARDESDANDLLQDTWHAAIRRPGAVHNVRAFLLGTMRKLARRAHRSRTRRERREAVAEPPQPQPSPDAVAEQLDLLRIVLKELRQLPATQQRILTRYYLEEMPTERIAQRERCTASTVRSSLSRGMARIRQRLDARLGDRRAWAAILIPSRPQMAASAGASGTATTALLTSTGAATVSTSSYVFVAVPVLLLGAWLLFDTATLPAAPEPNTTNGTRLAPATGSERPAANNSNAQRVLARAQATTDLQSASAIASPPCGVVVDQHTGEPVPAFDLRLRVDDVQCAVTTDDDGAFIGVEALPPGDLRIGTLGQDSLETVSWQQMQSTHPETPPIEVAVGPTFRLVLQRPAHVDLATLHARLHETEGSELEAPNALHTDLRQGPRPWVRFPFADALVHWPDPLRLRIYDQKGYWTGGATVDRSLGIEPNPVVIELQATGAVKFKLTGVSDHYMKHFHVHVRRTADNHEWLQSVRNKTLPGQAADDSLMRHLTPGQYTWWFRSGETNRSGSFAVTAGTTQHVVLDVTELRRTFTTTVWIREQSGKLDLKDAFAWISDPTGKDPSFNARAVRREDHGPGAWALELQDIPTHAWTVHVGQGLDRLRFSPQRLRVEPGVPPATIEVRDRGQFQPITVRIADAATGKDLPLSKLSYWIDGHGVGPGSPSNIGPLKIELPAKTTSRLFAWAPGYRMVQRDWLPERDGHELTFALASGWGSCVRVWHDGSRIAGAEVVLDGEVVGVTDKHGILMLARHSAPTTLSVQKPGFIVKPRKEATPGQVPRLSAFGINVHLEAAGRGTRK